MRQAELLPAVNHVLFPRLPKKIRVFGAQLLFWQKEAASAEITSAGIDE